MGSGFVLHPGIVNILIALILKCESEDFGSGGGGEGGHKRSPSFHFLVAGQFGLTYLTQLLALVHDYSVYRRWRVWYQVFIDWVRF